MTNEMKEQEIIFPVDWTYRVIIESAKEDKVIPELKKLLLALDFQVVNTRNEADYAVIGEAIAANAASSNPNSNKVFNALSIYAASADPPPNPAPSGVCLSR